MTVRFLKALTVASTLALAVLPGALNAQRAGGGGGGGGGAGGRGGGGAPGLTLTSTAWEDGGVLPTKYAGGMAVSPPLTWSNVPQGTVEFVLVMNDPEPVRPALSVSGDILHFMVVKIPATATSLPEGAGAAQSTTLPAGARLIQAYRGPGAPATGPMHHYTLTLYALNAALDLPADATRASVMAAMEGKVLARALYVGRFMQTP